MKKPSKSQSERLERMLADMRHMFAEVQSRTFKKQINDTWTVDLESEPMNFAYGQEVYNARVARPAPARPAPDDLTKIHPFEEI